MVIFYTLPPEQIAYAYILTERVPFFMKMPAKIYKKLDNYSKKLQLPKSVIIILALNKFMEENVHDDQNST